MFESNRWLLNDVCRLAVENLLYAARKRGLEPGIFCAIHTYGRRLNWHPHVHVSVTCGGLNKHGQWKKLSFLERRDAFTVDVEYAAAASESVVRGDGNAGVVVTYHDGITVEKPGAEIRRKILACVHVEEDSRRAEYGTLPGSLSEEATNSGFPTGSLQRRASLSFRYLDHKTGETATETLTQRELVARLKQHIPEKFFKMVRYFGFLANRVWREAAAGVPCTGDG